MNMSKKTLVPTESEATAPELVEPRAWTYPKEYLDRSDWSEGIWDQEPDKIQWSDPATGYPCLMKRNQSGVWCGYVGVNKHHPLYEVDYMDPCEHLADLVEAREHAEIGKISPMTVLMLCMTDDNKRKTAPDVMFDVHGGLTFASLCCEVTEEQMEQGMGICHVTKGNEQVWWFGFDCGHYNDYQPAYANKNYSIFASEGFYRSMEYVKRECESLAQQLKDCA